MNNIKKNRRLPSLNALRAFEVAARHMSFKAAAEELNVSQSAVSHQVKALEDTLGITLFARKTRAVELTRKGRLYYPILRNAFDTIAEGTAMILEEKSVDILTVQVYSTFTMRWLLPRLPHFQYSNENVQVRLHTAQMDVNFEQNDVDMAIMIGHATSSSLHHDYLFDCELSPVCSPDYLERKGPINTPSDLAKHSILQVYPSSEDWHVWLEANNAGSINPDTGQQLESYDVALTSAAQGMGIALGQQPYIAKDLQSGSLIELFPDRRIHNPKRWHLVYRTEKRDQPKAALFREWLLAEVKKDETLLRMTDNSDTAEHQAGTTAQH
jgi:LysR family glycine cleavage system transcriptional activator